MLIRLPVVIRLQTIQISNRYIVHLKLMSCSMSIIWKKRRMRTPDHTHKEHEHAVRVTSIRHLEWLSLRLLGFVRVAGSKGGKEAASCNSNMQSAGSRWTGLHSFHWPWAGPTSFLDGPGGHFSGMIWKSQKLPFPLLPEVCPSFPVKLKIIPNCILSMNKRVMWPRK